MATHSNILAWKTHGQRSVVGCSPWGRRESDATKRLHFTSLQNRDKWVSLPGYQALSYCSCPIGTPWGVKGWERKVFWPQIAELHIKGMISMSWDSCVFPFMKWSEVRSLSRVWLFVTPWTIAYQAAPSTRFSRQEYWSGLPFPSPEDLPNSGIEPGSPAL